MAEPVGPGPGPGPDGTVPDGRNPRTLAIIAGLAVLLVVGIVALLVAAQSDDDRDVVAGRGTGEPDQVTTTDQAATTPAPTTAPTTTEANVAAPPLTSGPAVNRTTTSAAVETRPTFTMSPTSGPPGTRFTASGTGCTGERAGAALTVFGPDGQGMTGTGAASMPDGSWTLEESIPVNGPTGEYRVEVNCMQDSTVLFSYAPQTFRAT